MRKKRIIACVLAVLFGAVPAGCGGNEGKQQGGNLTEMKTVEEILSETPAEDLIGKTTSDNLRRLFTNSRSNITKAFCFGRTDKAAFCP